MFTNDNQIKISQLMQDRTASQFSEPHDDSVVYEVQAEKEYVGRLKVQRQKIEALYSRYDVLLRDLKSKDHQLKEKDKTICNLETKCKSLTYACHESNQFKQQNHDIKSENINLQKAISELEESYAFLHGQFKNKEAVTSQKYDEIEYLNEQLLQKLKVVTTRYQEREDEMEGKYKKLVHNFEEFRAEAKRSKEIQFEENQMLKSSLLQREEQIKLLKTQNNCLKVRITEMEAATTQLIYEHEEKLDQLQKEKKCQLRVLKGQIENLKELNYSIERKWQKLREECELKDCSIQEMNIMIEEHDKQSVEALQLVKHQYAQEKGALKEQIIQYESHIEKLQRKIADMVRKEQCLYGKIKKYEVCMDAKRNLRQIEQQQMERIGYLLNLQ